MVVPSGTGLGADPYTASEPPTPEAPMRIFHVDAFTNRLHNRVIWMGNRNPLQRLKIAAGLRQLRAARAKT